MEADEPALGRKSSDHWRYGLRIARRYRMDKGNDQHYVEPSCRQGRGKNRRHRETQAVLSPALARRSGAAGGSEHSPKNQSRRHWAAGQHNGAGKLSQRLRDRRVVPYFKGRQARA